jgi:hypothetical protein
MSTFLILNAAKEASNALFRAANELAAAALQSSICAGYKAPGGVESRIENISVRDSTGHVRLVAQAHFRMFVSLRPGREVRPYFYEGPSSTTAEVFPRYIGGEVLADSAILKWPGLFVRRYRFPRVVDGFLVPATAEPLIACVIAGAAEFQEREIGRGLATPVASGGETCSSHGRRPLTSCAGAHRWLPKWT